MRKILIIATDDYLGAGRASYRIYQTLKKAGNDAYFLVRNKTRYDDPGIVSYDELVKKNFLHRGLSFAKKKLSPQRTYSIDPDYYFFEYPASIINVRKLAAKLPFIPDIIVATWISRFFKASDLSLLQQLTKSSLVLYPMDMSLLTGGCHYAWGCKGYTIDCDNCPAILTHEKKHLAKENLQNKIVSFRKSGANLITASAQLMSEAKQSKLFGGQTSLKKILLPVDEETFINNDRNYARKKFGIAPDSRIIFFGASLTEEKRKGVHFFLESLKLLKQESGNKEICILIAGKSNNSKLYESSPFPVVFTGYIDNDTDLSLAYQAADVFVCTSLQDSGPMMINESVMCGTPVVSFSIGVSDDLVENGISGYQVEVKDIKGLAQRISDILTLDDVQYSRLRESTRQVAVRKTGEKVFLNSFFSGL